ncbi:hypothetical protein [Streptomyces antioxidans]|uniref:hypothetical protein n=1 Tax=Streptomyces antioxidans TaxID=1507734 RepID=UPI0006147229|nr:hypothetical protein [Streptomyces antioxidans]
MRVRTTQDDQVTVVIVEEEEPRQLRARGHLGERPVRLGVDERTDFRTQALARLAAQHEEIVRFRDAAAGASRVGRLAARPTTVIGTCS